MEGQEQDPILQFFDYQHLPPDLQDVSRVFYNIAEAMRDQLPRNAERTVMFRKLLEAKDCAVRCMLIK